MRRPSPPFPPVTTATAFFRSMRRASPPMSYRGQAARPGPQERGELRGAFPRRGEMLGRELELARFEAEPFARSLEAAADHPGDRPGAGHALAPLRGVVRSE